MKYCGEHSIDLPRYDVAVVAPFMSSDAKCQRCGEDIARGSPCHRLIDGSPLAPTLNHVITEEEPVEIRRLLVFREPQLRQARFRFGS